MDMSEVLLNPIKKHDGVRNYSTREQVAKLFVAILANYMFLGEWGVVPKTP
jgi:hypothetical protein